MRFDRRPRYEPLTMTERKAATFARKQRRERERYPLLADQVAAGQHDLATEEAHRNDRARKAEQRLRDFHARVWCESRHDYFAAVEQRRDIREKWRAWAGPATSTYFRYVVDVATGEMDGRHAALREHERQVRAQVLARLGRQSTIFQGATP